MNRKEMEMDLGKLFIGGISWDTDEERLKEYFGNYGEVVEAVIMRDRVTGRARGFGFVVFTDPAIAERVTREKHMIDGRSVEAKKAVPREDQHLLNKGPTSIPGSPSPLRTRKIFVGGLASNVTEGDFKKYFDQFGTITDVVVMYDHNTQRPRGFGFITYDSEDAVDRVLLRTFHDLNGKMVEVKRAVPKELSSSPSRSPVIGYNHTMGSNRVNTFLNSYGSGYNVATIGGHGFHVNGGLSPISTGRGGASIFNGSGHGMGMNFGQSIGPSFAGSANLVNTLGYGKVASSFYNGSSRRFNSPIGYQGETRRSGGSGLSTDYRSLWANVGLSNISGPFNFGAYLGDGSGSFGASIYANGNSRFGNGGDNAFGLGGDGNGRKSLGSFVGGPKSSSSRASADFEEGYSELYRDGSGYGGSNWLSSDPERNISGIYSYGLGIIDSDLGNRNSESYVGNYNTTGIAA